MKKIKKKEVDSVKKSNRFRCQYQMGKICISETFESESPISSAQIIITLANLAVKVNHELNEEVGGRVALHVLIIHEFIMKNVHGHYCIGNGESKSYYLDKTSKNKSFNSERVDVEFRGIYGIKKTNPLNLITNYIEKYREYKHWDI